MTDNEFIEKLMEHNNAITEVSKSHVEILKQMHNNQAKMLEMLHRLVTPTLTINDTPTTWEKTVIT